MPNDGATAPACKRSFDIVVPVKAIAFDGEEQFARLNGSGVDGVSGGDRFAVEAAGRRHELRCPPQWELHTVAGWAVGTARILHARSAARAT